MNPATKYAVIGENIDTATGGQWSLHLHEVVAADHIPQVPLCQRVILDTRRIRNFGERGTFKSSELAPGMKICERCETLRNEEEPQKLWGVVLAHKDMSNPDSPWMADTEPYYLHARNEPSARKQAAQIYAGPNQVKTGFLSRVDSVGTVIGYHVEDKDGKILRV